MQTRKIKKLLHKEFNFPPETSISGNIEGLTNQKDLFTFTDTARKIIDNKPTNVSIKFVALGDGPNRIELEKHVVTDNLQNDQFFMGYRNNAQELLPKFNILLLSPLT